MVKILFHYDILARIGDSCPLHDLHMYSLNNKRRRGVVLDIHLRNKGLAVTRAQDGERTFTCEDIDE